jgi:ankyrin repeat protein
VDTEVTDDDGRTPLFLAIQENRGPVASILREKLGCDSINKPVPKSERTLLTMALEQGSPSAVKWLLRWRADVNRADSTGQAPLHVAVTCEIDDVELMIEFGALVNQPDLVSEQTPLHVAVRRGETGVKVVELLLESNADVTARDNNGDTPVHIAASSGCARTVRILLDRNLRVLNARNNLGESPLHRAAAEGAADVVEVLLQKGARADAENSNGHTALHVAVARDSPQVARILITHGPSVEVQDHAGRTPLQVAAANGNHVLARILVGVGANIA